MLDMIEKSLPKWTPKWQSLVTRLFGIKCVTPMSSLVDDKLLVVLGANGDQVDVLVHFERTLKGASSDYIKRHTCLRDSGQVIVDVPRYFTHGDPNALVELCGTYGFGIDLLEAQFRAFKDPRLAAAVPVVTGHTRGVITASFLRNKAASYPSTSVMWHLLLEMAANIEQGADLYAYTQGSLDHILTRNLDDLVTRR